MFSNFFRSFYGNFFAKFHLVFIRKLLHLEHLFIKCNNLLQRKQIQFDWNNYLIETNANLIYINRILKRIGIACIITVGRHSFAKNWVKETIRTVVGLR